MDFDITIVIPFYEGHDTIHDLLKSLPLEFPVIIVDDHSAEIPMVKRKNTSVFRIPKKGYFSGAVNFGIEQCRTDVLVLNQDVQFTSRRAFDLILENRDQYALIGESIAGDHPAWPKKYVHGTFMFMRRDAIQKVGLLNTEYYPLWGSTCEWQLRVCRKGYKAFPTIIPDMIHKRKGSYGSSIRKLLSENPARREWFIRTPPLISVIVPAYNHGRFLPELLNSLLGGETSIGKMPEQTFQSFDVIVADDCSTDNTQEIMQGLANPWTGVKYIKTTSNSGTSVACNLAIESSHAKYIVRIDADDMRESGSLEAMLKIQLQNPHAFVYDDVQLFTPRGLVKVWQMPEYNYDKLIHKNTIPAGIMFPKEAWVDVGGYAKEMRHGRDDWAFNVALGLKGWCGVHLQRVGYLYRRHGDNRTMQNTTPFHRARFKQMIVSLYPEAYEQERSMGCCGGSRPAVRAQTHKPNRGGATVAKMPGAEGLVLVEYLGKNFGNQTYYGPVTGATYQVSARKNKIWVDSKDLNFKTRNGKPIGLLDLIDKGGANLFKLIREPVKEKIIKATEIAETVKSSEIEPIAVEIIAETAEEKMDEKEVSIVEDTTKMIVPVEDDYFEFIRGIGKATSQKLVDSGYYSAEQLLEADSENLREEFGWSAQKVLDVREQLEKHMFGL